MRFLVELQYEKFFDSHFQKILFQFFPKTIIGDKGRCFYGEESQHIKRKDDSMELGAFASAVRKEVQKRLGKGYNISVVTNVKNNSTIFTGIMFQKEGEQTSPTVYIDDLYTDYREKRLSLSEIIEDVIDRYQKTMGAMEDICDFRADFKACQTKIIYRLVSRERNKEALKNMPYIPFLDLAITFHLVISVNERYMQSLKISKDIQKKWNVSIEQLFKMAKTNTERLLPVEISELRQMVSAYTDEEGLPDEKELTNTEKIDMIVVSNELGINGAAAVLYDGVIEKLAEEYESDLYLLPSSIHEMIVVPAFDRTMYEFLGMMVKNINDQYVEKDEILSDRVYVYQREEKKFS